MLGIIVLLFALGSVPWRLDDPGQVTQAFVSGQIQEGNWLVQNAPAGTVVSQPPLQGWLSALLCSGLGENWSEVAWRLPAFVSALLILGALWRKGGRLFGNNIGSVLAAGAFGLNFFVPRLATQVSSDMLLAAFVFFAGGKVFEKLRTDKPWSVVDQCVVFSLLLGATFTSGLMAYGFLLPGMIAFFVITRRWPVKGPFWQAWPWVLPLVILGAWLAVGFRIPGFQEQFFDGQAGSHFWPGYYSLNLLVRMPWTLLLAAMFLVKEVRDAVRKDPVLAWLCCWTLAGLAFAEVIPAKRFGHVLPVIPPLTLLLVAAARYLPKFRLFGEPLGRLTVLAPLFAMVVATIHTSWGVWSAFRKDAHALATFGERVRGAVGAQRNRLAVLKGADGLLVYTRMSHFMEKSAALTLWQARKLDWLVLGDSDLAEQRTRLEPFNLVVDSTRTEGPSSYCLIHRVDVQLLAPLPPTLDAPVLPTSEKLTSVERAAASDGLPPPELR
jgi:hypothetical protein